MFRLDRIALGASGHYFLTFRRIFVLNTMWTWLLTCELSIVSSLRDSFT